MLLEKEHMWKEIFSVMINIKVKLLTHLLIANMHSELRFQGTVKHQRISSLSCSHENKTRLPIECPLCACGDLNEWRWKYALWMNSKHWTSKWSCWSCCRFCTKTTFHKKKIIQEKFFKLLQSSWSYIHQAMHKTGLEWRKERHMTLLEANHTK